MVANRRSPGSRSGRRRGSAATGIGVSLFVCPAHPLLGQDTLSKFTNMAADVPIREGIGVVRGKRMERFASGWKPFLCASVRQADGRNPRRIRWRSSECARISPCLRALDGLVDGRWRHLSCLLFTRQAPLRSRGLARHGQHARSDACCKQAQSDRASASAGVEHVPEVPAVSVGVWIPAIGAYMTRWLASLATESSLYQFPATSSPGVSAGDICARA